MKSEGFQVFNNFFHAYLRERDLDKFCAMVSENVVSIGTGKHELCVGKAAFREMYSMELLSAPDPVNFEILECSDSFVSDTFLSCFLHMRVDIPGGGSFIGRFTGSCAKLDGEWRITNLHMSLPSPEQPEDSFFPDLHYKEGAESISGETARALTYSISSVVPGGILGAYAEEGLPFYTINNELLQYMGLSYEEFLQATGEMTLNIAHPDDRKMVERVVFSGLHSSGEYEVQFRLMQKGASFVWMYARGKKLQTVNGRDIFISVMINISRMIEMQEMLTFEASRDVLTPLLNRRALIKMIEDSFRVQDTGCFFIIDIDNFKKLNDTMGHQVGDAALKDISKVLLRRTRSTDIVARLGGDEFAVYYPGLEVPDVAARRADQIQKDFAAVARKKYTGSNISLSIGSTMRTAGMNFDDIYRNADYALYAVKNSGKKGFRMWPEM